MKKIFLGLVLLAAFQRQAQAQQHNQVKPESNAYFTHRPFLWGAASAAYQVEGSYRSEGKGPSVWDIWMNQNEVAGKGVNGNIAIDFYNRDRYLQDIRLLKSLGLNSYRFSISWPRILPDGTGRVNQAAINHYRLFVADLRAAGIEPVMTLYHWDLPYQLYQKGGWDNRESVEWFRSFAKVVFDHFKDIVKIYVLSNEMLIEADMTFQAEDIAQGRKGEFTVVPPPAKLGRALRQFNHKLLAAAAAARLFHHYRIPLGEVGVAFPLFPTMPVGKGSVKAATFIDGIVNRWFLDPIYKGRYPADILAYARRNHLDLGIAGDDAGQIRQGKLDYLGINYYAPLMVKADAASGFYGLTFPVLPNTDYAYNGANRPDQFQRLLLRMKNEYGNPPVVITENGAGFPQDDKLQGGVINDQRRIGYLRTHIAAMQAARAKGARIYGYHVWSSHDNLEWTSGYGRRFGLIYVDFATQQRTLKNSAKAYRDLIRQARKQ